jgi:hypothetical protein
MTPLKFGLLLIGLLLLLPLGISVTSYRLEAAGTDWRNADRSSAGLLPPPAGHPDAAVRIFAARTVRWRGIFAVHCWIVVKPEGAGNYTRYDYTAWGEPIRVNGFAPDGRWFGHVPEVIFAADGPAAAALIPRMEAAIAGYALRSQGDYQAWPGPNSNTFVAAVLDAVPEVHVALPPTAIGKDYPYDGRWARPTASETGFTLRLGGYAGLTFGWVEGFEVNLLGLVVGFDLRRPALKLPGLGRLGLPAPTGWSGPSPPAQAALAGAR